MGLSRERTQEYVFLGLIVLFAVMSLFLIRPFLYYLSGAVLLVYLAYPFYTRFRNHVKYESIAALLVIIVLILVAVIPTITFASMTYNQGTQVLTNIGSAAPDYIQTERAEELIQTYLDRDVDIDEEIRNAFRSAATIFSAELPGIIQTLLDALIGTAVMGFSMYYLFKDGDDVYAALKENIPLADSHKDELFHEVDNMAQAILLGHLFTSTVQGVVAGIGLWIFGIPNVIFWTFVMILLGIVPLVGNFLVWGPAGIFLIISGNVLPGIGLLIYGTFAVGLTDNLVRMKFVEKRAKIHPLLVLIGVIGGIPMFGLLGVVFGPLLLGTFITLIRVYRREFMAPARSAS